MELYLCSANTSRAPKSSADSHIRPVLFKYLSNNKLWFITKFSCLCIYSCKREQTSE